MKNIEHLVLMFSANFDRCFICKEKYSNINKIAKITCDQNPQD